MASPAPSPSHYTRWTAEEDAVLVKAVLAHGAEWNKWKLVADLLEARTSKQCKKRWFSLAAVQVPKDVVKHQAAAEATTQPTQSSSDDKRKSVHTALVGRTCEAFFEQKWCNGEIMKVRRDEHGIERCSVDFIGFATTREYKITEDGLWYDCVITEQTEKGYKVTFTEDGTKLELKRDQIRLGSSSSSSSSKSKSANNKRQIKEITTPTGYKVPESLAIAKADTEAPPHTAASSRC